MKPRKIPGNGSKSNIDRLYMLIVLFATLISLFRHCYVKPVDFQGRLYRHVMCTKALKISLTEKEKEYLGKSLTAWLLAQVANTSYFILLVYKVENRNSSCIANFVILRLFYCNSMTRATAEKSSCFRSSRIEQNLFPSAIFLRGVTPYPCWFCSYRL